MIYVSTGAFQSDIIKLLENTNNNIIYKFVEKQGIKMKFEVDTDDLDKAIDFAKKTIKESSFGKSLYFQVTK